MFQILNEDDLQRAREAFFRDKRAIYGDVLEYHRKHWKSKESKEWLMEHMWLPWIGGQRPYFGRVKMEKFLNFYGIKIDIV
jgi:hypothetical protein